MDVRARRARAPGVRSTAWSCGRESALASVASSSSRSPASVAASNASCSRRSNSPGCASAGIQSCSIRANSTRSAAVSQVARRRTKRAARFGTSRIETSAASRRPCVTTSPTVVEADTLPQRQCDDVPFHDRAGEIEDGDGEDDDRPRVGRAAPGATSGPKYDHSAEPASQALRHRLASDRDDRSRRAATRA